MKILTVYIKLLPVIAFLSAFAVKHFYCNPDYSLSFVVFILLSVLYFISNRFKVFKYFYSKISLEFFFMSLILSFLILIARPIVECRSISSKAAEAKIQLANLYYLEESAKKNFGSYSTCLNKIGFEQSSRGHYAVGFSSHDKINSGTNCLGESYSFPKELIWSDRIILKNFFKNLPVSASKDAFTAYAIGNIINAKDESGYDIWSINEAKNLVHVQDGTYRSFFQRLRDNLIGLFDHN